MFKIKDLMIKVVSEEEEVHGCSPCTKTCSQACSDACSDWQTCVVSICECTWCTNSCGCSVQVSCGTTKLCKSRSVGSLADLKAELKNQLAAIEAEEERIEESAKPQTLEEAEALEAKLEEALEEVRNIKSKLGQEPSD